ncbi:retrovirus-related pol polyprotein from transposon 17.6, partial [Tanacetum coccineum]
KFEGPCATFDKGHVISAQGVATDPTKVQAMPSWPIPKNIKQLRGFLRLTGYYRRFIKDFTTLSKPLTQLLKKNAYKWTDEALNAFLLLKEAMIKASVLGLPDFNKPFIVKIDASRVGIRAVLQQDGHLIAYLSRTLSSRHRALSAYEKRIFGSPAGIREVEGLFLR